MLLIAAGRAAQRHLDARLADHGLTLRHIGALGHLAHTQGLTYSDLARRARVTPQSMQATMTQLAQRGAITTATRGRATYPQLTDLGRALLDSAADITTELDHMLLAPDTDDPSLRSTLERIARRGLTITPETE